MIIAKRWLIFLALVTSQIVHSQALNLKITINNVRDAKGIIWVALHQSGEDFMQKRFMSIQLISTKGQTTGFFADVPPGVYAVSILHDANSNSVLDTNVIGIPTEGFGFSNDAMGLFGPPKFKKASFDFPKVKNIIITMKYM